MSIANLTSIHLKCIASYRKCHSVNQCVFNLFYRCVTDFNETCEYSLFTYFSWDLFAKCNLLITLQFQLVEYKHISSSNTNRDSLNAINSSISLLKWNDDSKPLAILILSMLISLVFLLNLMICESGERVTDQFELFGVEFGRCEWNKLPIEMQRMYLILLSNTQHPKNIRSYGGIMCTRDTFKQVEFLTCPWELFYPQFDAIFYRISLF